VTLSWGAPDNGSWFLTGEYVTEDWCVVQEQMRVASGYGTLVVQVDGVKGVVNVAVLNPIWDYNIWREPTIHGRPRLGALEVRVAPDYGLVTTMLRGVPLHCEPLLRHEINLCKVKRLTMVPPAAQDTSVLGRFLGRDGDDALRARVALYLFET
jgi:hypothetical protein